MLAGGGQCLTFGDGSSYFPLLKCMIIDQGCCGKNAAAGLNLIHMIYPHHRNNAVVWEGSVVAVISSARKIEDRTGRRGGGGGVWAKEGC